MGGLSSPDYRSLSTLVVDLEVNFFIGRAIFPATFGDKGLNFGNQRGSIVRSWQCLRR